MAAEAEKAIVQDQPPVPQTSAPDIVKPVEENGDTAAPGVSDVLKSPKPAETPVDPVPSTTATVDSMEAKDVIATADEKSKLDTADQSLTGAVKPTETATLPALAATEAPKYPNGVSDQPANKAEKPADDVVDGPSQKVPNDTVKELSEGVAADTVKEPVVTSNIATAAPATAASATNESGREDALMKDVAGETAAGETTAKDTEKRVGTLGNGKRKAEEAFGANGDSDRKKIKTDLVETPSPVTNGTVDAKKSGRKDRKILTPVGRTARKTRSQGPVEV